jgi:multidrug efflux pump subunit AcrB
MSRFFIDRPIVAMVIAIVFVIAGAVMILRLPVAQFPEIVPPKIQTTAIYTGADALTVEQSVATPIEEQVNGAKNMIYMQSINGNDGSMTLQVSFDVGTNVDLDQVQVQNRLAQATASLPAEVSGLWADHPANRRRPTAGFHHQLAPSELGSNLSFELCRDQHPGRAGAHSGHRPGEGIRLF